MWAVMKSCNNRINAEVRVEMVLEMNKCVCKLNGYNIIMH